MNQESLEAALAGLPLGGLRFYRRTGSTNDLAIEWAATGAPDNALVIADEQTAGRGQIGRRWYTPPGVALAFSLILRPGQGEQEDIPVGCYTALGALAVCDALDGLFQPEHPPEMNPHDDPGRRLLESPPQTNCQIKWPNDVLIAGRKVAGVLAETSWMGERLMAVILGIGINVASLAVPQAERLDFPAASLQHLLGFRPDREAVLRAILHAAFQWRGLLPSARFLEAWWERLAFRGTLIQAQAGATTPIVGEITGLDSQGHLQVRLQTGQPVTLAAGDVRLRPLSHLS